MKYRQEIPLSLRFSLLHRTFQQQLDQRLNEHELTGVQLCVLGQLIRMEQEGRCCIIQRDLERASRVTHPTMTEILKRLEKKEFIQCRPLPQDRRYKSIRSTGKAAALGEEMRQTEDAVMDWLCRDLTGEERSAFLSALDKMLVTVMACCGKGQEHEGN